MLENFLKRAATSLLHYIAELIMQMKFHCLINVRNELKPRISDCNLISSIFSVSCIILVVDQHSKHFRVGY